MRNKRSEHKLRWIEDEVKNLKSQGLFTKIKTVESPMSSEIVVDGKKVLNFCSNNYLGLANHPRLKKATKKAIGKYGIGPTAVRTIAGTTKLHSQLEKRLAKFKKVQAVITMQSGFAANTATIPAIVGEKDVIFSDELNHASIIDGCQLSRAKVVRYKHMDTSDLEKKVKGLRKASQRGRQKSKVKKLIVTDGVFSMDGDIAPLENLQKIAEKYAALLMVDDAHGEGILGKNGRGIVNYFGLHGKVDIEIGTMSKAFGVVGGYVAGKRVLIDWLKQRARPFLFSSAMTIPDTAACIEAVKILTKSEKLVNKLWENTSYLKSKLNKLGFNIGNSQTPIIPVMLGDAKLTQTFSKKLFGEGIFAVAIGYPTVAKGEARIRVMNSASHSTKDIDAAVYAFEKVGKKLGVLYK